VPELPDILLYLHALTPRVVGHRVERVRLASPFLLRSVHPPLSELEGKAVVALQRLGKRIVFELEGELFLVLHLMIAGRLRWKEPGTKIPGKVGLLAVDFDNGSLILTEAGTRRQASLFLVKGRAELHDHDPGGINVLEIDFDTFTRALREDNHTLKRALTDPRLLSGIGGAYSDEILHRAHLSPLQLTNRLTDEQIGRLHDAARSVLTEWTERLRREAGGRFPAKVTAFHPEMAVHGKFGQPCPVCGSPVRRIVYAENESNYCATCQTGGRLLADRALSRLLKDDWPRSLDEWDAHLDERRK
jgi:formamidopyrimidine-DNA glycosylase